jgi:LPXTG cell wall anchor motif
MRKLVSALAVTAGLTLLAAPVYAQTTTTEPEPYPPTTSGLTVSETTLSPGETFTASGSGAEPGARVTFTLRRSSTALGADQAVAAGPRLAGLVAAIRPQAQSVSLGSTTANAEGEYSATLRIPLDTDPGLYSLIASSGGEVLGVVTIRVVAGGGVTQLGLPFTGGNVLPGLAIGATLIVAGGLLLLSLKRRRRVA